MNKVVHGDNLEVLAKIESGSIDLIYIDPPFNTGKTQTRTFVKTEESETGDRVGFGGKTYETTDVSTVKFDDKFDDFIAFIEPRIKEARRLLKPNGSFYFHIDYREVHYCKVLIDKIFGRECFLNEIIWAYDYGAKTKKRWPAKHDNILVYVKDPANYVFNVDDIDRIPYMAPGLCGPEKAAKGKLPTDTWWMSIVGTNSHEKMGYPTQKPVKLLERIICASSPKDGLVLDFFAGSGTTGQAAMNLGRKFIMVDSSPDAISIMKTRFEGKGVTFEENQMPKNEQAKLIETLKDENAKLRSVIIDAYELGCNGNEGDIGIQLYEAIEELGYNFDEDGLVIDKPEV